MHKLYDENGNLIPHGGHEGEHHHEHHHHEHHHHEGEQNKDENMVLLTYMLHHNEQHAAELEEVAQKLEKAGFIEEGEEIKKGVADFQQGNAHLGQALDSLKTKIQG